MVQAWYMDSSDADKRQPHQCDPPAPVNLQQLEKIGVIYTHIDIDDAGEYKKESSPLSKIRKERGYTYEDTITVSASTLPNYEEKLEMFYAEHLHTDEEIRLILDGCGYFDVRDSDNKWIRIEVTKGDLLVLPAGIYHRFTPDNGDYIVANRLFVGEPVWKAYNRSEYPDMPVRQAYVDSLNE